MNLTKTLSFAVMASALALPSIANAETRASSAPTIKLAAVQPAVTSSLQRSSKKQKNELGVAGGAGLIIGIVAAAAVIAGIVIIADDSSGT